MNYLTIDAIDATILKILLKESRTSFTEIAKECKISVSSARMRYNHLKKVGIINGEIMHINPFSLGYVCVASVGINTSVEDEEAVIEHLNKTMPWALTIVSWGKYNVAIIIVKKTIEELASELRHLDSDPHIKLVDPLIWTEVTGLEHSENLVMGPQNEEKQMTPVQHPSTQVGNKLTEIDEIDRQITEILTQNSRTSFRKIAKQLGVSTKKVIQRYKRLKNHVLALSTITVNFKKLGFNAAVMFFAKCERNKMPEINEKILQIPNVIVFQRFIGSYDLHALAVLEDFGALIRLQKNIRSIHGIEHVEFFITDISTSWPPRHSFFTELIKKKNENFPQTPPAQSA